ncbi:MAG: electron transfer flavoprotein subunit alpha/FixB family protein [Thermoleophilia bacterium]|nr:electron transfer flavoprotein subunit alpha/FixB family protein [Thermoleophilia bacterium]
MTANRSLLVVVEPPREGLESSAAVLLAEAARLGARLDVDVRSVTWPPEPGIESETLAVAVAEAALRAQAVVVLVADTDLGRQLAPLVARRLGSGAVVGCTDVRVDHGWPVFVKPVYSGWLEQEIAPAAGTITVVALDLAGMAESAAETASGAASKALPSPEVLAVEASQQPRVRSLEVTPPDPASVDLVYATRIVAAGSGGVSPELLAAVDELAALLGGSVGATRPVVDDGYLPKERLIGQTGRTVAPELYMALGVSGSPHHVAGVRAAEKIVAINRDVRAPIFQFADVGYVADLEEVLPALVRRIKEWRDAPA